MKKKGYSIIRRSGVPSGSGKTAEQIIREAREAAKSNYRTQSLRIHGLICAKCGREFDIKESHLLTVHHRDGNSANNPPDGSNWENLCVYCHDDEHSRSTLGDYFNEESTRDEHGGSTLGDYFAKSSKDKTPK